VYGAILVRGGPPGMALGTRVVLKFDAEVDAEQEADSDALPHFRNGRTCTPLASLPPGGVLREAHAYAALLGGAGVAALPAAPVPAWCLPFVCEQLTSCALAQPSDDCKVAYTQRRVHALVLPRLGRSLYNISRNKRLSHEEALAMGAPALAARRPSRARENGRWLFVRARALPTCTAAHARARARAQVPR
jgi:hypothetical protein